ncbi:hypothetical protein BCEP27_30864 [Burkholderia cepacia]
MLPRNSSRNAHRCAVEMSSKLTGRNHLAMRIVEFVKRTLWIASEANVFLIKRIWGKHGAR